MQLTSAWIAVGACIALGGSQGCGEEGDDRGAHVRDERDPSASAAEGVDPPAVQRPSDDAWLDAGALLDATSEGAMQEVTIAFKAKIGNEELACARWYADQGASKIRATVRDFRMFVEEIRLVRSDGVEVEVELDDRPPFQTKDVALLDFTDRQGRCTAGGPIVNTTITGRVPRGAYSGVVFVNGVPEALNHLNIVDAKPPLQDTTTYWGWRGGYRFIMCELFIEESANRIADAGMDDPTSKLVHFGSGGCSQTPPNYVCTRPNRTRIALSQFDPARNAIVADLGKVFENIDLSQENVDCHGPDPVCRPAYEAFGVGIDDGMVRSTQTVFRVE